ncbi:MAG: modA [Glaciihabitans sp.]|nr:modA [Glaciihabitans sp.]
MEKLTHASLTGTPVNFATNRLEIAVPKGNPARVRSFADLAKPAVKTVVCAAAVPCGAATLTLEQLTGVTIRPVSEETAVTDVLGKVRSGEADAGLVYVTDVRASNGSVDGVTFPESTRAVNAYPISVLKRSNNARLASAFVAFVLGSDAQSLLSGDGFGAPH